MLVILSGVSGAGKDTIKQILMKKEEKIVTIPSYTTREKRPQEEHGVQYFFVTHDEFENLIKDSMLYEHSNHHGNYYGTAKMELDSNVQKGNIVLKDIDVNGTENLSRILPNYGIKVVSIFLNIDKDEMIRRLENRDDNISIDNLNLRISRYDFEVSNMNKYDYVIKNVDAEKTADIILEIIKREL